MIGSGWEQYALVEEIKKQGHKLIATHPSMNTDGFELADVFFVKDSTDIASHLEIAKTYEIDGVITDNCDYSLYTASIIAEALKLPSHNINSAIYSNNKFEQRNACHKAGIRQPKFFQVETLQEAKSAAESLGYPLIIKPIDSRGTFGVTILKDSNDFEQAFYEAIINSPSKRVICEEFISGTLVTVDGFCFSNGHKSLTVASRTFEDGAKPITKEIIYPAEFDLELNQRLLENHHQVVQTLDYSYGHSHGEYIVNNEKDIYLVECTNRGGGVYTSSTIVPTLTGINLNKILIDQSLGLDQYEIELEKSDFMQKSVMLTFLDFEEGKVIKSINKEELAQLPYVMKYRTIYGEQDMIESIENCASRHSMLVITGDSVENTYSNFNNFKSRIKIEYYSL